MPEDICPRCLVEAGLAVRMAVSGDHAYLRDRIEKERIKMKMICPRCLEAFYI